MDGNDSQIKFLLKPFSCVCLRTDAKMPTAESVITRDDIPNVGWRDGNFKAGYMTLSVVVIMFSVYVFAQGLFVPFSEDNQETMEQMIQGSFHAEGRCRTHT